jgi:hypothetical protein
MSGQAPSVTMQELYTGGIRLAQSFCSILTTPIEYALRPQFGTRYFDPIQLLMTVMLMALLPLFGGAANLIPLGSEAPAKGLIGLGTVSLLFFAGAAIHGPRLWRRVFHMELERHSQYEGDPLPLFERLPLGQSFWAVRVLWEPALVAVAAIVLRLVMVLDRPAAIYFLICAGALAFKNYLAWYQSWLQLRTLMDTKFAGPLMAKAVTGRATEKELAPVHMAGFAGSVPAEIRAVAISQMAPTIPALPAEIASLISAVEPVPSRLA